jgi:hypothetical protein
VQKAHYGCSRVASALPVSVLIILGAPICRACLRGGQCLLGSVQTWAALFLVMNK